MTQGEAASGRPFVLKDVSVRFRRADTATLQGINLEVHRGEFVGIIGPTGCGKTTLLNVLAGVVPHYIKADLSGEVLLFGEDTRALSLDVTSPRVGFVLQDPESQLFNLIVRDEIVWGLENRGLARTEMVERLEEALQMFSIKHLEERVTYDLSGGEKQRVAIASIYATKPEVILLDDPTSQLDPLGAADVIEAVNRLAETGEFTIVMVEDNVDELLENVERVVMMDQGQILLDATPRDFCEAREIRAKTGIQASQVAELHYTLKDAGVSLGQVPFTVEEASRSFRKLLSFDTPEFGGEIRVRKEGEEGSVFEAAPQADVPVLVASEVEFTYPPPRTIHALRRVDTWFGEGDFIAIVGRNGSGKTTLAKCLSGYLQPTNGSITSGDRPIGAMAPPERVAHVGYVFQNPDHQLFKETVWEEVAFGLRNIGTPPDEVERAVAEVLASLELDTKSRLHPFKLSKGDRQRLAVASVAVLRPNVLIVDEPTTGQDPVKARDVMDLLLRLNNEEGICIMVISHAMDLVAEYARRTIVMHQGEVLLDGPTREVFSHPEELEKTSVVPPPVTRLALSLGFSPPPITIPEAQLVIEGELSTRSVER